MPTMVEAGTSSDNKVWLLLPHLVTNVKQQLRALMVEYSTPFLELYDVDDLLEALQNHPKLDTWLAVEDGEVEMAAICQLSEYPNKNIYSIVWVGGRGLKEHFETGLTAFEQRACLLSAEISFTGRKGWERLLRSRGYSTRYTMSKNTRTLWSH